MCASCSVWAKVGGLDKGPRRQAQTDVLRSRVSVQIPEQFCSTQFEFHQHSAPIHFVSNDLSLNYPSQRLFYGQRPRLVAGGRLALFLFSQSSLADQFSGGTSLELTYTTGMTVSSAMLMRRRRSVIILNGYSTSLSRAAGAEEREGG